MLTLAIGDIYIPDRAFELPQKFRKLLCPNPNTIPTNNKLSKVLCLGNVINSYDTLKFLYDLSPSFNMVRGEFDSPQILSQQIASLNGKEPQIPTYNIIQHDNLKIGFTNGYLVVPKNDPLALLTFAREIDVDILIWGGTHKVEAYTLDGKFFINPGSATGAYNFDWPEKEEASEDEGEGPEDSKEENPESLKVENKEKETDNTIKKNDENNIDKKDETENNELENKQDMSKEVNESKEKGDADSKDEEAETNKEDSKDASENDINLIEEVKELTSAIPSFCLLDTHDSTCTLYIYTYFHGEVKVDKVTYQKE
ncbi:uncharacterized protein AC631_00865 [Debaryomyces fabryi]|uniref:Vacuolar protein sorting-associated protein 29 n=1 Tax=Debaryomyces fabryi TaxID=58627 RepID=A0A0V1Q4C5_9ASCO|nr:uncharacterized protein AC631_00865 [Debaryomyces fabryi]KSA03380.1 hypothetical protein AC631_00865 [Debaryomyces fabryi]CUM49973.1 unnamed protein product [Debaryomyces fabryi]